MAHLAVHSANFYSPLQAPLESIRKFAYIQDPQRRRFAAMLDNLDQSVGRLIFALQQKGMLHNSIILFTTDNGGSIFSNVKYSFYSTVFIGPAAGFDLNKASNWPLRGIKNTLWEGGVRGSAFLWSPLLKNSSRVHSQGLMGIQDWLPTLYHAAGTTLFYPDCRFSDYLLSLVG